MKSLTRRMSGCTNSQLMFNGLDNVQAGGRSDLFGGELN